MKRVRLLSAGRAVALGLFVAIAVALLAYLVLRVRRVQVDPARPKLQGKVVAVFSNTHYSHEVSGQVRFNVTAGADRTYQDGTHELEQVKLESYGAGGDRHDIVTADRAKVSDPSDLSKLDAEFADNVVVQTSEGLTIKTSYLHFDQVKNVAETREVVEFEGRNYVGRATGAVVEVSQERANLLKDVDVTIKPDARGQQESTGRSKQSEESPEAKAARKAQKRARKEARRQHRPEQLAAAAPRRDAAASTTPRDPKKPQVKKPTRIQSESAVLEKKDHRVTFDGNVTVTQDTDEMRAARMVCYTNASNHLERIEARGNSYLKQTEKAEIKSRDMDFFFGDHHQLVRAIATPGASARSLGPEPVKEASADTIEATFADGPRGNAVDSISAQGKAVVKIHAPASANNKTNPAERELTADGATLQFFPDGRNIKTAEATGNAVLTVTPTRAERGADKKTLRAPRMNAAFYEEGNQMKTFTATDGVRIEFESTLPGAHPPRVTTSKTVTANFLAESQDVDRISQEGNFKYNEADRNATAERATYNGQTEILNLRGKRPMVWDAKGRTQADEIDYDRQRDETHARGDVRTTYYSRESTSDSTPFKNTKSPIFLTAERADAQNEQGIAVYTINARGWQDDNFIKADRIELYQDDKRMAAIGNVESALYQAKRETSPGQREVVPGFATADRMNYSDADRKVHYEGAVKARQGTDRIEASIVDVYLKQETNEVDHMNAEGNVVLTQPGRRGVGDKLVYASDDGRAVLTGKARVDDAEKGTTMGSQLTYNRADDRISAENQQGSGRVRSTHRLTKTRKN